LPYKKQSLVCRWDFNDNRQVFPLTNFYAMYLYSQPIWADNSFIPIQYYIAGNR
jgi:hypothetical protein